ncbi:uncharacterized protein LOC143609288 [Bidens hawaiensis]|uniref:uncharacterized protein LOC143609288 n=1 Tax=Bidens hawaiensis TaxID=980011 RepID=UPI00404A6998
MTTPLERMEAIMASLVQERSQMNTRNAPINKLNANVSGNDAPKLTKSQRRKRRKTLMKVLTADLGSLEKREDIGISSAGTGDGKSSNFIGEEHTKVATGKTGSSLTTNLNREVEVQKAMETTTGKASSGSNAADNTVSKKRKRNRKKMNNNNPDLGDTLSAPESTHEEFGMTKVLEVTCNETVASKTTTPDANLVSIEEVANIKTGKSETTYVNGNGMEKSKKKPDLDNKQPTLSEILNPWYPQSLELDNKRPTLVEILNPRYHKAWKHPKVRRVWVPLQQINQHQKNKRGRS